MQDFQYHEVTPRTDKSAGLHNINPRHLTHNEFKHYASLVSPEDLPEDWKTEAAKRLTRTSDTHRR